MKLSFIFYLCVFLITPVNIFAAGDYEKIADKFSPYLSEIKGERIAIIYPYSINGRDSDGVFVGEKLLNELVKRKYTVVEPVIFRKTLLDMGIESLSNLNPEKAENIRKRFSLNYIISGTVFLLSCEEIEVNLRLINLKNLEVKTMINDKIKKYWDIARCKTKIADKKVNQKR